MKQKYTLNIADLQISVISDAPAEDVAKIGGILDRKMREIYLKSRCPKTEAALLCAMDFAADRMNLQNEISDLEERCDKYALVLENLKERNADQTAELERLRSENAVLRSLLSKEAEIPVAPDPISPAAFFAEVAEAQTMVIPETAEETVETAEVAAPAVEPVVEVAAPVAEPVIEEPAPVEAPAEPTPRPRSRVGNMFRHLSFGDVD